MPTTPRRILCRPLAALALLHRAAGAQSPPAQAPALALHAAGVQIYACVADSAGVGWRLTGPEAELRDVSGARVGRHFAGPSWQAADGSTVVGEPVASSPSPQAGAIPWLVLRATTHAGDGTFARVAYVTRTQTTGGVAPVGGCDQGRVGRAVRVPYAATYTFFPSSLPSGAPRR